jgi:DNA repair protein SbcC/Rad50
MEEKDNRPEKKAGMPPVPPGFMRPSFPPQPPALPGAAGKPGLPPPFFNQSQGFSSPAPLPSQPSNRDAAPGESARMKEEKDKLEKKIVEMEKLVSQEKEKALLATLKNQQDEALSSKVESSLKDIQDKLRRDRHEQEVQEERLTHKAKIKDLESRLVSDRETWMQTLKAQMQERETQSKDVEGHFIYRLQEMERRWLDEKAQWQKIISQKEDEVRTFRHAAEKQKELEDELRRSAMDKELLAKEAAKLRDEISKLERDKASIESYIKSMPEREREISDIKVENAVLRAREEKARDEVKLAEERFRRDSDALQKEIGRLQSDIGSVSDRKNSEKDEEMRKLQARHQADLQEKEKTIADISGEKIRAISELLKMKGLLSRVQAINAVLEKERQSLRLEKMQMAQAMAANIEDVRKYRSEAEVLKAAHQTEFQKFKNDYAADTGAQYSDKITELERLRQTDLRAAARKHEDEMAQARAEAAQGLENKIAELRAKYEADAGGIRAGVKKELELEYTAEIARLRNVVALAEDDKIRLKAEAKHSAEEAGGLSERLARAQKEFDDSKTAMAENYKRLEAQINALMEIKAENERGLAAALAAKSSREQELAGLGQVLNSANGKAAGLEAELAAIRQKTAELEQNLQDLSGQLEAERLNSAVAHDDAARQAQSAQERIAAISAELATYKQMESSFPERMKWALKGKKSE